MPRDRKTDGIDFDDLLTPEDQTFVTEWLKGGNAAEAYRIAYPKSQSWTPNALYVQASRKLKQPKIRLSILAVQEIQGTKPECQLENHLGELASLREEAKLTGNYGAAVQAEVARGKVSGLYVERIRNEDTSDSAALADAVEALAPELAAQLRAIGATKH